MLLLLLRRLRGSRSEGRCQAQVPGPRCQVQVQVQVQTATATAASAVTAGGGGAGVSRHNGRTAWVLSLRETSDVRKGVACLAVIYLHELGGSKDAKGAKCCLEIESRLAFLAFWLYDVRFLAVAVQYPLHGRRRQSPIANGGRISRKDRGRKRSWRVWHPPARLAWVASPANASLQAPRLGPAGVALWSVRCRCWLRYAGCACPSTSRGLGCTAAQPAATHSPLPTAYPTTHWAGSHTTVDFH